MRKITTKTEPGMVIMDIPGLQKEVVRFKLTIDLSSPVLTSHPSLIAQLAELLEAGTKKYTRDALTEALESIGSEVHISHNTATLLTFNVCSLTSKLQQTLDIVIAMLMESTFTTKEIARVKKLLAQELLEESDDAAQRSYGRFSEILYSKTFRNHIPNITRRTKDLTLTTKDDIKKLHAVLSERTWMLSVVGNNKARTQVAQALQNAHHKGAPSRAPEAVSSVRATQEWISIPSKANVELVIGNVLPLTQSDSEYNAFHFGLAVLAKPGGFSGRLMSTVREKEGLTYMIYGRTRGVTATQHGAWFIQTFFTPKDLERGIAATVRELQKIVDKGITQKELSNFKTLLSNQFLITHESDKRVLHCYHDALIAGLTADDLVAQKTDLETLTRRSVNTAIKKYMDPGALVVIGAGPVEKNLKIKVRKNQ